MTSRAATPLDPQDALLPIPGDNFTPLKPPPLTPGQYASLLQLRMASEIRAMLRRANSPEGNAGWTELEFSEIDLATFRAVLAEFPRLQFDENVPLDILGFAESMSDMRTIDFRAIAATPDLRSALITAQSQGFSNTRAAGPLGPEDDDIIDSMQMTPRQLAAALEARYEGTHFTRDDGSVVVMDIEGIARQTTIDSAMKVALTGSTPMLEAELREVFDTPADARAFTLSMANEMFSFTDATGSTTGLLWNPEAQSTVPDASGQPTITSFHPGLGDRIPVGVAPDFLAQVPFGNKRRDFRDSLPGMDPADRATFGGQGGFHTTTDASGKIVEGIPPTFFEDDISDFHLAYDPPGVVAAFQAQLVQAGLLEMGAFRPGLYDEATLDMVQFLMTKANETGAKTIEEVLDRYLQFPEFDPTDGAGGAGGPTYEPLPERPPDIATLVQDVKTAFRQRLGREPRRGEIDLFMGSLASDYHDLYLTEEENRAAVFADTYGDPKRAQRNEDEFIADPSSFVGRRSSIAKQSTAQIAANRYGATVSGTQEVIPQVDPVARFLQRFEAETAGERARKGRVEDAARRRDTIQSGLFRMRSLAGSRRVDPTLGR